MFLQKLWRAEEPKILASFSFTSSYMTFRESAFYGKNYFAKKNIKIALAPPIELFIWS
jgi:hypothetical protein